jgi:preprotein translocase subunit SecE
LRLGLSDQESKDKMSSNKSFFKQAVEFFPQVKQEMRKVTWPSRRETTLTTTFVFVFAAIAAVYFAIVDQIAFKVINYILGLGQ